MNAKRILFPTDLSLAGKQALELASSLARDSDAELLIVHVEEPAPMYGDPELYQGSLEPDYEALGQTLREVVPPDPTVRFTHRLLIGNPIDEIVAFAEAENVDLIVMPTHGRTGLGRLLMGSVAEAVLRRAPCPVITVRQPAKVAAGAA